jgi:hypothetical protein
MKNFFKLFGVIALVAVIGFSMAACKGDDDEEDGGGGDTSGNFNLADMQVPSAGLSGIQAQFSGYTGAFVIHSGTQAEIEPKLNAIKSISGVGGASISKNNSFSGIEEKLKSNEPWYKLTNAERTQILTQLKNSKYVVGSKEIDSFHYVWYIYDTATSTWN